MLYASSKGPPGDGQMSREEMNESFAQVARGDSELFARKFLTAAFLDEGELAEIYFGTEIRRRHSRNFMRTFERLCRLAKNCDVDGIIEDSLMQNAFGLLYLRMQEHKPTSD